MVKCAIKISQDFYILSAFCSLKVILCYRLNSLHTAKGRTPALHQATRILIFFLGLIPFYMNEGIIK